MHAEKSLYRILCIARYMFLLCAYSTYEVVFVASVFALPKTISHLLATSEQSTLIQSSKASRKVVRKASRPGSSVVPKNPYGVHIDSKNFCTDTVDGK